MKGMIIRNCDFAEFFRRIEGRELVCFGAGKFFDDFPETYDEFHIEQKIRFIADNDKTAWGTRKIIGETEIPIVSPETLYNIGKNTVLLISAKKTKSMVEIYNAIKDKEVLCETECYFAALMHKAEHEKLRRAADSVPKNFRVNPTPVIPKKIHYCWFGGNTIPYSQKRYMESWRKFCPDYEIIEWNESNYDCFKHPFMKRAYEAKKWGFVTDYARLDIIYSYGGIYFDTDVEIIRPIDELLYNTAFCGFENFRNINTGLGFGGVLNFPLIKALRDDYDNYSLVNGKGELNTCPRIQTDCLRKYGLKAGGEFQTVAGMTIYPMSYFCPTDSISHELHCTEETYSIHWYAGTWVDKAGREAMDLRYKFYMEARENERRLLKGE